MSTITHTFTKIAPADRTPAVPFSEVLTTQVIALATTEGVRNACLASKGALVRPKTQAKDAVLTQAKPGPEALVVIVGYVTKLAVSERPSTRLAAILAAKAAKPAPANKVTPAQRAAAKVLGISAADLKALVG